MAFAMFFICLFLCIYIFATYLQGANLCKSSFSSRALSWIPVHKGDKTTDSLSVNVISNTKNIPDRSDG